eukprot:jgi/Bigna1/76697/fgenesh1_pg.43_\
MSTNDAWVNLEDQDFWEDGADIAGLLDDVELERLAAEEKEREEREESRDDDTNSIDGGRSQGERSYLFGKRKKQEKDGKHVNPLDPEFEADDDGSVGNGYYSPTHGARDHHRHHNQGDGYSSIEIGGHDMRDVLIPNYNDNNGDDEGRFIAVVLIFAMGLSITGLGTNSFEDEEEHQGRKAVRPWHGDGRQQQQDKLIWNLGAFEGRMCRSSLDVKSLSHCPHIGDGHGGAVKTLEGNTCIYPDVDQLTCQNACEAAAATCGGYSYRKEAAATTTSTNSGHRSKSSVIPFCALDTDGSCASPGGRISRGPCGRGGAGFVQEATGETRVYSNLIDRAIRHVYEARLCGPKSDKQTHSSTDCESDSYQNRRSGLRSPLCICLRERDRLDEAHIYRLIKGSNITEGQRVSLSVEDNDNDDDDGDLKICWSFQEEGVTPSKEHSFL